MAIIIKLKITIFTQFGNHFVGIFAVCPKTVNLYSEITVHNPHNYGCPSQDILHRGPVLSGQPSGQQTVSQFRGEKEFSSTCCVESTSSKALKHNNL